jgi:hypothetical protein
MDLRSAIEPIFQTQGKLTQTSLTFEKQRHFPPINLWGARINGGDVTNMYIAFYPSDRGIVVMSEIPCYEKEIPIIEEVTIRAGITISAIHNHWIEEEPFIMYLHWEVLTQDPIGLAQQYAPLWRALSYPIAPPNHQSKSRK